MKEEEIGLRNYFEVIRKRWKTVIATFLLAVITSVVVSLRSPNVYQASALVKIGKARGQLLESIPTIVEIFRQGPILREIAQDLRMPLEEKNLNVLKQRIKMKQRADLLQIIGEGETRETVLQLVNSVTKLLLERHHQILSTRVETYTQSSKKLEDEIEDLRKKIKELEKTGSQVDAILALGYVSRLEATLARYERIQREIEDTAVVVPAELPRSPVRPQRRQNVLVASFLGMFLGIMFAFIQEYLSHTVLSTK